LTRAISSIFDRINDEPLTGTPSKDWLKVRSLLRESGDSRFKEVDYSVQYLMAFNRRQIIASSLSDLWLNHGAYVNARIAIDAALTQEQLMSDDNDISGLHVMTIHKSKGKQFDGVIIFHEENISPLTIYRDEPPYLKSKKLLRVAVTRASKQVLFLTGVISPPAILNGYQFK
jgi:DNA helicase-2/ATP-dependent DNA helicase PcrA